MDQEACSARQHAGHGLPSDISRVPYCLNAMQGTRARPLCSKVGTPQWIFFIFVPIFRLVNP